MSRPRISFPLILFYLFLKGVVLFVVRIFYGKVHVIHPERLKLSGPAIIISNHPSTMMDPLNVACRVNRIVHFLANASLFPSGFGNWFFNTFYCIPVARQKDKTKRKINNQESFERAYNFLSDGGCLFIAAEGVSTQEHDLKPLRTGTARIALGTEGRTDYSSGLQIIPVGIYYEDAQRFRNRQILEVGEPIRVKDFEEEDRKDHRRTVKLLTGVLNTKLAECMVITDNPDQDSRFRVLETILQTEIPKQGEERLQRSKKLASWIRRGMPESIKSRLQSLQENLKNLQVSLDSLGSLTHLGVLELIGIMITPVGLLFNFLPGLVVWGVKKALNLYDGYSSSVYILAGLVFFPVFYRVNNLILSKWVDVGHWWPLSWIFYLIAGLIAWYGLGNLATLWRRGRFRARLARSAEAREALANYLILKEELQKLLS